MNKLAKYSLMAITAVTLAACSTQSSDSTNNSNSNESETLTIAEQGIYSVGGTTTTSEGTFDATNQWEETGVGQTSHVDHANVLYQVPAEETGAPIIFLHGYGQSRMGWQTTPDGREEWSDMFLRDGHSVYLIDEPHRGEVGQTSTAGTINTTTFDQRWYTQFRIGTWTNGESVLNEGSQFPEGEEALDQFFRQMTPDTGMSSDMGADFDNELVSKALADVVDDVYERTGQKPIVITHSQGGGPGWTAATLTENIGAIVAIVAIEPGGAPDVTSDEFNAIVEQNIPVTFYFGDYIDNGDESIPATAQWQAMKQSSQEFVDGLVDENVEASLVDLPAEGITGNTHFMFQDKNNADIQDMIKDWITENIKS